MAESVLQRLCDRLESQAVPFELTRHEPVYTSQQAAAVRGTRLSSGAKALVCKADEQFVLLVLPADRRLAGSLARRSFGWRKLRFATPEEVLQITTLTPGAIPPFGSLFDLPTHCDPRLAEEERINFNAGDHAVSIAMTFADYVRVEQPQMGPLAE